MTTNPLTKLMLQGKSIAPGVRELPDGEIVFESGLQLDTDGAHGLHGDATHQSQTSMRYVNGASLDANAVPFFVLPLRQEWWRSRGVDLGDIALVAYGNHITYAVFGDLGPPNKLGEGSIELHRRLGFERVHNGRIVDSGIDSGVITMILPKSRLAGHPVGQTTLLAHLESVGATMLDKIMMKKGADNVLAKLNTEANAL
jgi:Fungal chitosanase of glycosyl hydrolase group 75